MVRSTPADNAELPSGAMATALIHDGWPGHTEMSFPVDASLKRKVPSQPPPSVFNPSPAMAKELISLRGESSGEDSSEPRSMRISVPS